MLSEEVTRKVSARRLAVSATAPKNPDPPGDEPSASPPAPDGAAEAGGFVVIDPGGLDDLGPEQSQGYETKASAEKGIEAIKTHAPGANVEDHS